MLQLHAVTAGIALVLAQLCVALVMTGVFFALPKERCTRLRAPIDVDHFKTINDRLGHEAGDRVLIEMGLLESGDRADPWSALAAQADKALYRAKPAGRDRREITGKEWAPQPWRPLNVRRPTRRGARASALPTRRRTIRRRAYR